MRRTIVRIGGALGCFVASTGAFYLSLRLPLPEKRIHILALLGGGVLLALLGGLLLGGSLWRCIRRGGRWWIFPVGAGVLCGVAFYGVLSPFGGYPLVESMPGDALVTSLALFFLVANSYVVGRVLLPRRREIPGRNALAAVAILYGSMLLGMLWYRVYPLTWSVPLSPVSERKYLSLEDYVERVQQAFPRTVNIAEKEDGSVSFQAAYPSISAPEGYEPYPEDWHDDVIVADATEIVLPEGRVCLLGMPAAVKPRRTYVDFHTEVEGRLHLLPRHDLVLLPWETSLGSMQASASSPQPGRTRSDLRFRFGPPIPGPLQLRLNLLRREEAEYVLPNEPGAFVHLAKNSVQLLRWMKGFCGIQHRSGRRDFAEFDLIPQAARGVWATAVLSLADRERVEECVRIDVLKTDGTEIRSVGGRRASCGRQRLIFGEQRFIFAEVPCASDEVEAFRIVERPRVTQVRLPVPPIPDFPPENDGLENLLDMRVPWSIELVFDLQPRLRVRTRGRRGNLLEGDLESRCAQRLLLPMVRLPGSETMPLREFLSRSYPGRWRVKGGKIIVNARPGTTVVKVLRQAMTGRPDQFFWDRQEGSP